MQQANASAIDHVMSGLATQGVVYPKAENAGDAAPKAFDRGNQMKGGTRVMSARRERQHRNRRLKHRREGVSRKNYCGVTDLTAYNAIRRIETHGKAEIILK